MGRPDLQLERRVQGVGARKTEPDLGAPHVRDGTHARVSRKTRPVRCSFTADVIQTLAELARPCRNVEGHRFPFSEMASERERRLAFVIPIMVLAGPPAGPPSAPRRQAAHQVRGIKA